MVTATDFFCGGGGLGLGMKGAGIFITQAFDFDKYAVAMYQHNVGGHGEQRDITTMIGADIIPTNVWAFGFPCTDLSGASVKEQEGLYGKRSGLFFEVMRLLDEVESDHKPEILWAENVPELGQYLDVLEAEFAKRGYKLYAKIMNSKNWGVPQNRERYIVIGVPFNSPEFVFPEEVEQYLSMKTVLVVQDSISDKHFYTFDDYTTIPDAVEQSGKMVQVGQINKWLQIMGRVYSVEGIAPTLHTSQGGHRHAKILDPRSGRIRRLTVREYARLQGFSDEYEIVVSDTQAYKIFGNAVSVPVAKAVGLKITEYLENLRRAK